MQFIKFFIAIATISIPQLQFAQDVEVVQSIKESVSENERKASTVLRKYRRENEIILEKEFKTYADNGTVFNEFGFPNLNEAGLVEGQRDAYLGVWYWGYQIVGVNWFEFGAKANRIQFFGNRKKSNLIGRSVLIISDEETTVDGFQFNYDRSNVEPIQVHVLESLKSKSKGPEILVGLEVMRSNLNFVKKGTKPLKVVSVFRRGDLEILRSTESYMTTQTKEKKYEFIDPAGEIYMTITLHANGLSNCKVEVDSTVYLLDVDRDGEIDFIQVVFGSRDNQELFWLKPGEIIEPIDDSMYELLRETSDERLVIGQILKTSKSVTDAVSKLILGRKKEEE